MPQRKGPPVTVPPHVACRGWQEGARHGEPLREGDFVRLKGHVARAASAKKGRGPHFGWAPLQKLQAQEGSVPEECAR